LSNYAVDDFEFGFHGLRVLDGDDAFASDLVEGLGDERPDLGVVVGRDGRDLTDHVAAVHFDGAALEVLDHGRDGRIEAGLEGHGAGSSGHVAHALVHQGLGHHGGRGRAVTGVVLGLRGHFLDELGAHVREGVLKFDVLGDGHAVVDDRRAAPRFL